MRDKLIGLRVDADEYKLIEEAAKKHHIFSAAGFVRMCVSEHIKRQEKRDRRAKCE